MTRWFQIAAALIYRYWTGTPLLIIAIVAVILFPLANVLMAIAARQQPNRSK
jgi:uncharacterized membrane protein